MSSDQIILELEKRDVLGKKVKHLRRKGLIPAVIHNHGLDSIIVQGDIKQVNRVYNQAGKHHPVILKLGDQEYTALIKDVHVENKHQSITHLVFNAVRADQTVEAEVPIHPKYAEGNEASPAERAGLMVLNQAESVKIDAIPKNLPDVIYYDAEKLVNVGDHVKASDLILPEGVKLVEEQDFQVAAVFEPSAIAAANDAAGGDQEEVSEVEETETNPAPEGEQAVDQPKEEK